MSRVKLFTEQLRTFPSPLRASTDGIVDFSDDLRVERLLEAYSFGIFPWPHDDMPTLWFSPARRGILDFADFHVPRSLQKFCRNTSLRVSFDQAFLKVLEACAEQPRPDQSGTWITDKIRRAYLDFHRAGYAHSVEVWDGSELAGGLYGVYVAGLFCGESMFFRRANASKLALVQLVQFLMRQGLSWMDIQMVTPVMESFGGKYVPRREFLRRLEKNKLTAKYIEFNFENSSPEKA